MHGISFGKPELKEGQPALDAPKASSEGLLPSESLSMAAGASQHAEGRSGVRDYDLDASGVVSAPDFASTANSHRASWDLPAGMQLQLGWEENERFVELLDLQAPEGDRVVYSDSGGVKEMRERLLDALAGPKMAPISTRMDRGALPAIEVMQSADEELKNRFLRVCDPKADLGRAVSPAFREALDAGEIEARNCIKIRDDEGRTVVARLILDGDPHGKEKALWQKGRPGIEFLDASEGPFEQSATVNYLDSYIGKSPEANAPIFLNQAEFEKAVLFLSDRATRLQPKWNELAPSRIAAANKEWQKGQSPNLFRVQMELHARKMEDANLLTEIRALGSMPTDQGDARATECAMIRLESMVDEAKRRSLDLKPFRSRVVDASHAAPLPKDLHARMEFRRGLETAIAHRVGRDFGFAYWNADCYADQVVQVRQRLMAVTGYMVEEALKHTGVRVEGSFGVNEEANRRNSEQTQIGSASVIFSDAQEWDVRISLEHSTGDTCLVAEGPNDLTFEHWMSADTSPSEMALYVREAILNLPAYRRQYYEAMNEG